MGIVLLICNLIRVLNLNVFVLSFKNKIIALVFEVLRNYSSFKNYKDKI